MAGHKSCEGASGGFAGDNAAFVSGCLEAKRRLDPIDARRRGEPQYRTGFSDGAKGLSIAEATPTPSPPPSAVDAAKASKEVVTAKSDANWVAGAYLRERVPSGTTPPAAPPDKLISSSDKVFTERAPVAEQRPIAAPQTESRTNPLWGIFLILAAIYFLPSLIALSKGRFLATFVANLVFGWTLVGWFIILIWSLTPSSKPTVIVVNADGRVRR
jgi:hypothetical protein